MEEILDDYRKENSRLQSQINDYQTFSLEMIRVFHNRVQEKIVDENIPDFMRDLYTESPFYLENDSLKGMLETFAWMSLSDKEKINILDADLDAYFSKFDVCKSEEPNLSTKEPNLSTKEPNLSTKQPNLSTKDIRKKDGSLSDVGSHSRDKYSDRSESSGSYTDDEYSDERYTDESYSDESPLKGDRDRDRTDPTLKTK